MTSILGLERKFAPGMKDSGTWENFTVEYSEGIVKNPAQRPGKAKRSIRRAIGWEDSTARSPTQTSVRQEPRGPEKRRAVPRMHCLLPSVPFSLPQALRKASGLEAECPVLAFFCPAQSPLHLDPGAGQVLLPPRHWIPYSPPNWTPLRKELTGGICKELLLAGSPCSSAALPSAGALPVGPSPGPVHPLSTGL